MTGRSVFTLHKSNHAIIEGREGGGDSVIVPLECSTCSITVTLLAATECPSTSLEGSTRVLFSQIELSSMPKALEVQISFGPSSDQLL